MRTLQGIQHAQKPSIGIFLAPLDAQQDTIEGFGGFFAQQAPNFFAFVSLVAARTQFIERNAFEQADNIGIRAGF